MPWTKNKIGQARRRQIFARDGFRCHWCKTLLRRVRKGTVRLDADHATIDHVIPRSRGGDNSANNVVACCHACNQRRSKGSGSAGLLTEAQLLELIQPKPLPYEDTMYILKHGKKAWRAWKNPIKPIDFDRLVEATRKTLAGWERAQAQVDHMNCGRGTVPSPLAAENRN